MKIMPPVKYYPLPHPFPSGKVWAAIRDDVVTNMIYMELPEGMSYTVHRQRSRATLARNGVVWSGRVENHCFVPRFESTDHRLKK
ncbi:MAG: hypothetical protein B7Y56_03110 [Gallionellales bacterium 35-53-114]|jgi:hypothetical protein|nr:MAG: hypothetical protein B7Y56_03110 [Gallionellales bacterium 35-53-114]OYZ65097.1 MAG: hypothetical protein B7Y04_00270 [Gallionellales bacterium 24-53-125]OZB08006.1 MAG: hypothetical protein B7X61_10720 [Gallionellales bacterium 39-52-133]HQS59747.1 hypothetical protein [Gallionellaceae bacterium]HQS76501.1 hypothetical protein [Gallionellaceae bacterium]